MTLFHRPQCNCVDLVPPPVRLTAVLLLLATAGCTGPLYDWQVRTHSTVLLQPLNQSTLDRQSVAVLPAVSMPALRGNEVGLGRFLFDILHKVAPHWNVVSEEETTARINRNGFAGQFTQMRSDYEQSTILDRDVLRAIAAAIQVRYVFQPRLAAFSQIMTDRWQFPVLQVWLVRIRSSIIRLSLQLWDTETGDLVWASVAEGAMWNEAVSHEPVFLEDIAKASLSSMVSDLFNQRTAFTYTPLNEFLMDLMQDETPH
jgi:hypothetical protein